MLREALAGVGADDPVADGEAALACLPLLVRVQRGGLTQGPLALGTRGARRAGARAGRALGGAWRGCHGGSS